MRINICTHRLTTARRDLRRMGTTVVNINIIFGATRGRRHRPRTTSTILRRHRAVRHRTVRHRETRRRLQIVKATTATPIVNTRHPSSKAQGSKLELIRDPTTSHRHRVTSIRLKWVGHLEITLRESHVEAKIYNIPMTITPMRNRF